MNENNEVLDDFKIEVFDTDVKIFQKNPLVSKFMGEICIDLNKLPKNEVYKKWIKLNFVESGELFLEFKAKNFGREEKSDDITIKLIPSLKVKIIEGKDLISTDPNGKSDPILKRKQKT
jgi:Ca2+-dependent lipid-binding protein